MKGTDKRVEVSAQTTKVVLRSNLMRFAAGGIHR